MIKISLTDFLDFIIASGSAKQTLVARLKKREEYAYAKDYWRELRNTITDFHADPALTKAYFDAAIETNFIDAGKKEKARLLLENYKKFLGRKTVETMPLVKCDWRYNKHLTIRVNPELHVTINGVPQIIKFYFKSKPTLTKAKIDMALVLMKIATDDIITNVHYSILDLPQQKIWTQENPNMKLMPLLKGEAESYITIYQSLP
ncbi:MAG TPA: hypothetical protein PKD26_06440 [Pyrinomonadaceae bacterium]|nr:hypothetical protein [Pyrinomonadaceae bacterium]